MHNEYGSNHFVYVTGCVDAGESRAKTDSQSIAQDKLPTIIV